MISENEKKLRKRLELFVKLNDKGDHMKIREALFTDIELYALLLRATRDPVKVPELPVEDRCHPECPGWGEFNHPEAIQKCDECDRFVDDHEAALAAAASESRKLLYILELTEDEPEQNFSEIIAAQPAS